jgi:hypothetical protein
VRVGLVGGSSRDCMRFGKYTLALTLVLIVLRIVTSDCAVDKIGPNR